MKLLSSVFAIRSFCIAGERLTPCQAAMHPFLAPEFPCTYLLPWQGNEISGVVFVGIFFVRFPKSVGYNLNIKHPIVESITGFLNSSYFTNALCSASSNF